MKNIKPHTETNNLNNAVEDILAATKSLLTLYEEETKALKDSDTKSFLSLQDNKIEMAHKYQEAHIDISAQKEGLENVSSALKERLKKMDLRFKSVTQDNLKALKNMDNSMNRLNNRIMHAAKTAVQEKRTRYGADGALQATQAKSISMGISESA